MRMFGMPWWWFTAIALLWLSTPPASLRAEPGFALKKGDVVVFVGGDNMVRGQRAGYLETLITRHFAAAEPKFRDLSWEADTVFAQGTNIERWRHDGFGDLPAQLRRVGATLIIAQYGKLESLEGRDGLERFVMAYERLLDRYSSSTKRIVLLSPTRFEKPFDALQPDLTSRNKDLALYVSAIRRLAVKRELKFVDLFHLNSVRLTRNGIHIRPDRQALVAAETARRLGVDIPHRDEIEPLRRAVIAKHQLWYDYWRPANWKCLFGDDARRIFGRGGPDYPSFQDEWKRFPKLIEAAEQRVAAVAAGRESREPTPPPIKISGSSAANAKVELAAFKPLPGMVVNLFASEEQGVRNPLAMRWDPRGRLFVACSDVYPQIQPGGIPNDRIVMLEDADGDGRAEKSTVFANGLNIPTGLEIGDGGVYVGQGVELLFLKDNDGDGRADERRVLLSGFGTGDTHQTINSFVWSPGGEMFFCQGDGIESRVETPWGVAGLYQAGILRLRPKRMQLHGLLDDFMGPGNPWGLVFDDWGQGVVIDGAGGISHFTPALLPTSHRLKLPRIGKPGGYCGVDMLSGRHLPDSMRGDVILGDFKRNTVSRFRLRPKGAGFEVAWKDPFLRSTHRNFRPVDMKQGPDGAVYIADWYNPITCHQDDSYRHPDRDKSHGRIWRVTAEGRPLIDRPDLAKAPLPLLLEQLRSSERWTRYQVKRMLTEHDRDRVAAALGQWVKDLDERSERFEQHLFEALSVYETLELVEPPLLRRALNARDHRIRAYATRVVGRWADRLPTPLKLLEARIVDEHPLVRMEAILACGSIPLAKSIEVAARAIDHAPDQWIDYAFTQCVHHLKPHWLPAFQRGEIRFGNTHQLAEVLQRARTKELLATLEKLARDNTLEPKARGAVLAGIVSQGDGAQLRFALDPATYTREKRYDAALHAQVLRELRGVHELRKALPAGDPADLLKRILNHDHDLLRARALELVGLWRVKDLKNQVVDVARAAAQDMRVRRAAMSALARLDAEEATSILDELAARGPAAARSAATEALCEGNLKAAALHAAVLLKEKPTEGYDPATLFTAFLEQEQGAERLLESLADVKLSRATAERGLWAMHAAGRTDAQLMTRLRTAAGIGGAAPKYNREFALALARESRSKGDAARGATIFRSAAVGCATCHAVNGSGGRVGPDLTSVGTTVPADRIVEEVLWPSRQVKQGYALTQVVTEDGRILQGYERTRRGAKDDLLLLDVKTAQMRRIPLKQIEARRDAGSPMPEGLAAGLTRGQLLDLFRYLTTLGEN